MSYCTLAEMKTHLGITNSAEDDLIMTLIGAAQRTIESYCVRTFKVEEAQTRLFTAASVDGTVLHLGADLCEIVRITNGDGSEVSSAHYAPMPLNHAPYYAIVLYDDAPPWVCPSGSFIEIHGRWGYSIAPPADIVQATKELVAWLYRMHDEQQRTTTRQSPQSHRIPPVVRGVLSGYQRKW